MCNECKKEIKHLKDLIGVDGEDFLERHDFSNILQALSYLLTHSKPPEPVNAKIGAVRPRDGYFTQVDARGTLQHVSPTQQVTVSKPLEYLPPDRKRNSGNCADLPSEGAA